MTLLGGIDLRDPDGRPVREVLAQPKRLAVLMYLAAAPGQTHRRDTLFVQFWPEADQAHARGALNRTIYFLRQALGPELILTHGQEEIGVSATHLCSDVAAFELELARGARIQALERYRGDLAPGFQVNEAPGFERWLDQERDRLRTLAVAAAFELARSLETSPEQADHWGRWAQARAPCDERIARWRMTLLDRMGDRGRALAVFEELGARLRAELEIEPSPETAALALAIRARVIDRLGPVATGPPPRQSVTEPAAPRPPSAAPRSILIASGLGIIALTGWLLARPPGDGMVSSPRWVQVTLDEGVEFQPALAPDGNELAYITMREGRRVLALRSAAGDGTSGVLLPALAVAGDQGLPAWTPDGEHIRFTTIREGNPGADWWEVGRLGGTPHRLSLPWNSRWLAWSRDGTRLALLRNDTCFVTDPDRTSPRALDPGRRLIEPHSLAWSPDQRWIALVEGNSLWPLGHNTLNAAIDLLDATTGRLVPVTDGRQLNVSPAWLDAGTLVFISDRDGLRELYAVPVGPDGPRGTPHLLPGGAGAHGVSLSAGGRRLALARMEVRTGLRMFRLGGAQVLGMKEGTPVVTGNQVSETHDLSPDGTVLLFDSDRRGGADLFRLDLPGDGEPTPFVSDPGDQFFPQWSPDGHEVAYYGGPGPMALWVIPAGGGRAVRVSDSGEIATNPRWSPDGLHLAYMREETRPRNVWLRSRKTLEDSWGPPRQVTRAGCYLASWMPNGDGVVCRTADGRALLLVSPEGRLLGQRDLTALGFRRNPMVLAHDSGFYFLGTRGSDTGIWRLPFRGDVPRLLVRADDLDTELLGFPGSLSLTADQLLVTVGRMESDLWLTDLR